MNEIVPYGLETQIRSYFDAHGLTDAVGGPEALEQGFEELKAGILPVLGELVAAETSGDGLSEAVFDAERYPHLVRVHGFLNDVLVMDVPAEIRPWAERLSSMVGRSPKVGALRRATARMALRADARAQLARFALFEALCLNQRLLLRAEGAHLEAINGRSSDIESIAEREVDLAVAWERYGDELMRTEDPLRALVAAAAVALQQHVEQLNDELLELKGEVHEVLDARRQILEVMDALPADQAVLVYNECAEVFGEDKLEAEQLRVHHPAMLGSVGRDAIYQRVHRLPAKIEQLKLEKVERRRGRSFADLILNGPPSP